MFGEGFAARAHARDDLDDAGREASFDGEAGEEESLRRGQACQGCPRKKTGGKVEAYSEGTLFTRLE